MRIGHTSIVMVEDAKELILRFTIPKEHYMNFATAALSILNNKESYLKSESYGYGNYPYGYGENYLYSNDYKYFNDYMYGNYIDRLYNSEYLEEFYSGYSIYDNSYQWFYLNPYWEKLHYGMYDEYYSRSIYREFNSESFKSLIIRKNEKVFISGTDKKGKRFHLSASCPDSIEGKEGKRNTLEITLIVSKKNMVFPFTIVKST